jgi:hypothetical protein
MKDCELGNAYKNFRLVKSWREYGSELRVLYDQIEELSQKDNVLQSEYSYVLGLNKKSDSYKKALDNLFENVEERIEWDSDDELEIKEIHKKRKVEEARKYRFFSVEITELFEANKFTDERSAVEKR